MAEADFTSPGTKSRWGRLKRSHSHDEQISPVKRALNVVQTRKGTYLVPDLDQHEGSHGKSKKVNGVFRHRRNHSDENGGLYYSENESPRKTSSKKTRFQKSSSRDSGSNCSNASNASPGAAMFGLRRRKGGKPGKVKGMDHDHGDYSSDDENDAMSSSADESVAPPGGGVDNIKARLLSYGRRTVQKQQRSVETSALGEVKSRPNGSALRTGKFQTGAGDGGPPRRAVSFDEYDRGNATSEEPRTRAASSDQATAMVLSDDQENQNDNLEYDVLDFPIQKTDSMMALPSAPKRPARERARYSVYHGNTTVKKKFRVRPYHCFADEPLYMTEEEIYADSLTTSKEFVQLKSYLAPSVEPPAEPAQLPNSIIQLFGGTEDGRIGSLRVEVLGCVSLHRTKPDTSVYLVCGDSAFCTDVLSNYRSPMWPSISRRACIFPIHHAFAKLYVGVFDVSIRKNKENDVFCGRVSIDISAIRPNTEYDVTMPLRASTFVYDKRKRGVIRLRFSLHWYNERAAVLSYFKPVQGTSAACPMVEGQPAIPCADPKTFRNVAVTVYGQDLPGKYSKNAFRATVREMILYQQNMQQLLKGLVLDAMLYEKPWISFYLFGAAMYCVGYNTFALVPAILVGYILILYLENYFHFVEDRKFNLGYKPLTIMEVFKAVSSKHVESKRKRRFAFSALQVEKRAKRRTPGKDDAERSTDENENYEEIVHLDHREFPFADRDAYPKFSVEDALAPGSSKGGTGRLHGRLSVYYAPTQNARSGGGGDDDDDDDDSDSQSERDDETVMTGSHMMGDSTFDLDSEEEEGDEGEDGDFNYKRAMSYQRANSLASKQRRLRLGPPQDTEVRGKKVPPQQQLKKVEALIHKFSLGIAQELVHAPPRTQLRESETLDGIDAASSGMTAPSPEVLASVKKRAKKATTDDFDKLLGLESGSSNPIHRILASFMGPLLRMIRVAVYLLRISFNVTTWRDPYLSFWVLVLLSSICFILIFFPWRFFFLVFSIGCLGPQNIFVRRYLAKKAAAKELEALNKEEDLPQESPSDGLPKRVGKEQGLDESVDTVESREEKSETRRGFFGKRRQAGADSRRPGGRQSGNTDPSVSEDDTNLWLRPAFESALHGQSSSSKKLQPKAVAIPYSRLKKDRFYDWPPDPTVSRATPIDLYPKTADDSLTASVPSVIVEDDEEEDLDTVKPDAYYNMIPADIPRFIAFPSNFIDNSQD